MTDTPQITDSEPSMSDPQTGRRQVVSKAKRDVAAMSKTDIVLKKLRSPKGATLKQLADATGWQLHSVRGFLSATVRKKLEFNLVSEVGRDDVRRYRIIDQAARVAS